MTSAERPSRSIPPPLRYGATSSAPSSTARPPNKPRVPSRKPSSLAPSPPRRCRKWVSPTATLCAPGHWRPQKTTPMTSGASPRSGSGVACRNASRPETISSRGCPAVVGSCCATNSSSAAACGTAPATTASAASPSSREGSEGGAASRAAASGATAASGTSSPRSSRKQTEISSASGPSNWTGPGEAKLRASRHPPRRETRVRNGAPSRSTAALWISGTSLPRRRSAASSDVSGTPRGAHSSGGPVRPRSVASTPLAPAETSPPAARPSACE
mmetsp:Transcript_45657/g.148377  ORF Transcript_45657/g.148377 Transcript_45657/m.148377 type:complete len:273 (-) Transcript_45657:1491-2309(-)